MSWPKLDLEQEYYMEIGTHMVEKHGMMLDRYTVWESMDIPGEISMGKKSKFSRSFSHQAFVKVRVIRSLD